MTSAPVMHEPRADLPLGLWYACANALLLGIAAADRNTIVLVTGDHGQAFNENGQNEWGHNNSFSRLFAL